MSNLIEEFHFTKTISFIKKILSGHQLQKYSLTFKNKQSSKKEQIELKEKP